MCEIAGRTPRQSIYNPAVSELARNVFDVRNSAASPPAKPNTVYRSAILLIVTEYSTPQLNNRKRTLASSSPPTRPKSFFKASPFGLATEAFRVLITPGHPASSLVCSVFSRKLNAQNQSAPALRNSRRLQPPLLPALGDRLLPTPLTLKALLTRFRWCW